MLKYVVNGRKGPREDSNATMIWIFLFLVMKIPCKPCKL
jgi:hypothetical protein